MYINYNIHCSGAMFEGVGGLEVGENFSPLGESKLKFGANIKQ